MIEFQQVVKRYESGHEALNGVNFHVGRGEMLFVTGRSGAGKSTLLRLLALIERPSHGRICVNGHDLAKITRGQIPAYRRGVGVVFQDHRLLNDRTVFDNVALPLVIAGTSHKDIGRRVRAALDKVGLLSSEKHYPQSLSTGEQQRIGIARAIVTAPPLLLADEPTGNLDPELAREVMQLFSDFNQIGATVLIVSHDLSLIEQMGKRQLTIAQGQLVGDEPGQMDGGGHSSSLHGPEFGLPLEPTLAGNSTIQSHPHNG